MVVHTLDSQKSYTKHLADDIWAANNISEMIGMEAEGGHTHSIHCPENVSEKDMISRIVRENVDYGIFESQAEADDLIRNLISFKADEIANWRYSSMCDFKNPDDYRQLTISMDMGEKVGHGFNKNFQEMETPVIKMVLRRNDHNYLQAPYGFNLVTAYPDISSEKAKPTNRSFTREEIVNGGLYDFKSPLEKAAFICSGKSNAKVYYNESLSEDPYIKMSMTQGNTQYYAYMTNDHQHYTKRAGRGGLKTTIPYSELKKECPALASLAQTAMVIAGTKTHTVDEKIQDAKVRAEKISTEKQRFAVPEPSISQKRGMQL